MSALGDVPNFINEQGNVPADSLSGKVLGLYFSAHWCPPCRGFTPKLAEWYNNFKANHPNKDQLEIVFVSSDKTQEAFDDYFAEMPWAALPYELRDVKDKLSKEFKVRGIPTLVFLDADRKVITSKGRSIVTDDPTGEGFPWAPKTFAEDLGTAFVNANGEAKGADAIQGKYLGLYFSAHWCPPCRGFTPELVKTYNKVVGAGKPFEIVFASSDKNQEAFDEYMADMPWLALPFEDRKRKAALSDRFDVEGIPTFVILDPEGNVVNADGRSAVAQDPEGADFPWHPKPLNELNEDTVSTINDGAVLIAFGADDAAKDMLKPIAEAEAQAAKASGGDQLFFMHSSGGRLDERVREFAKLGNASPLLVILNVPGQSKCVATDHSLTDENVRKIVADFTAGKLQEVGIAD